MKQPFLAILLLSLVAMSSCNKKHHAQVPPETNPPDTTNPGSTYPDRYFREVNTTFSNTLAIDDSGYVWAAGANTWNLFGLGHSDKQTRFVRLMNNAKAIALKDSRAMVLKNDNSVWSAGLEPSRESGAGANGVFSKVFEGAAQIEAGGNNGFIIKADNTLWACGRNIEGELGLGNNTEQEGFVKIMDGVKAAKAFEFHSLIIKTDNSLWAATGDNFFGHLGMEESQVNLFAKPVFH